MDFFIHFTYPWILYILFPMITIVSIYRFRYYKPILYRYSLASMIYTGGYENSAYSQKILFFIRAILLSILALLIAKPRIIDFQSKIQGEGVDMVLALDVSNSMQFMDDPNDERTRLDVAKEEAIKFIDKREHDPIGLVIFGRDAVSRCPVTLDKNILKSIIKDTTIGTIDGRGTLLNTGIIMAANRLKDSKGISKVMVVLTDGTPYGDEKTHEQAVAVAKKFGIKIYTVGIGHEGIVYVQTPFGLHPMNGVNKELLQFIADQTGGKYFEAKKPDDMKAIYDTIDKLEKRDYETNMFNHYHDIFKPFLYAASILAIIELVVSSFVWFML